MKRVFHNAEWIGLGESGHKTGYLSPAFRFRKVVRLAQKSGAKCVICGLGCYAFYVNGKRVADDVLSPAFTDYNKRALYVEYDLSDYLKIGDNVLAIELGDGFFNQTTQDTWHFCHSSWRNAQRFIFCLTVGDKFIVSDTTWKASANGPTVHSAIRTGEYYDATKEDDWLSDSFDDSLWKRAVKVHPISGALEQQLLPPIRECGVFEPKSCWKTEKGIAFDFGKNVAGYVGISASGNRGDTLRIRYAEKLNGKELDQSNIDFYVNTDAFSEDRYTFKGQGEESWKPKFVYHGFQYVEVIGAKEDFNQKSIRAYHVHTDLEKIGEFSSSNELLNWIYDAGILSFLNNYHGFLQDCPHREKNGWTGDAAVSAGYSIFNFEVKQAYKKLVKDIIDTQRPTGQICSIAPTSGWGYNWGSGPAWDYALFTIPYELYLHTGDTECIDLAYPAIKKYLRYAKTREEDGTVCFGLGDWRPPDKMEDLKVIDNRLSDTCFYYSMFDIASKMAKLKGLKEERSYKNKAEKIKQSIIKRYVKGDSVDNGGQGALSYVLHFGIVDGDVAKKIAKTLADTLINDKYKFKVGILGIKAMLNALSLYGYTDVAFKAVNRYDYPSYGYWKNQGATTLWESWLGDVSRNHHMFGDVLNWMHLYVAGVQNKGVGYDKILIKPYFFDQDCACSCSTKTPYGELSVKWEKKGDLFTGQFIIPKQCKCELELEDKEKITVSSSKIEMKL